MDIGLPGFDILPTEEKIYWLNKDSSIMIFKEFIRIAENENLDFIKQIEYHCKRNGG